MSLSYTVSKIVAVIFPNLNRSRDPEYNQDTTFEVPSFTNSKDMIGAQKLKKRWVTWLTMHAHTTG